MLSVETYNNLVLYSCFLCLLLVKEGGAESIQENDRLQSVSCQGSWLRMSWKKRGHNDLLFDLRIEQFDKRIWGGSFGSWQRFVRTGFGFSWWKFLITFRQWKCHVSFICKEINGKWVFLQEDYGSEVKGFLSHNAFFWVMKHFVYFCELEKYYIFVSFLIKQVSCEKKGGLVTKHVIKECILDKANPHLIC